MGNPQAEAAGLVMQPPLASSLFFQHWEGSPLRDGTFSVGVCLVEVVSVLASEGYIQCPVAD